MNTPEGYRWVSCSLELDTMTSRHRHLIRKGKDVYTTVCGTSGMPASVWRGSNVKPECPACVKRWAEKHPDVPVPAKAEVRRPAPRPIRLDDEPAKPLACSNCGVSYDACTARLRKASGKCCCSTCHQTATHNQHAWEAWDARRRKAEREAAASPTRLDYRAVVVCTDDPCTYCRGPAQRHVQHIMFETYAAALAHGWGMVTKVYGSPHRPEVEAAPIQTWKEVTS